MQVAGQAARQVLRQPSARDVGHPVHGHALLQERFHQGAVEPGGPEQGIDDQGALAAGQCCRGIDAVVREDAPHEAEAIAVHAAAGHRQDAVTRCHGPAIDDRLGFHHGHAEAGQVVATRGVEPGHLSRLPPKQGTAALAAAVGDALHHLRHCLRAELARGDVIQEEQGFCTAGDHVVDAHRHQIDAHLMVTAMGLGEFQLGAHPVAAGHEQRLLQPCRQPTEPAEAAQAPHHLRPPRGLHTAADAFHKGAACQYIHACRPVIHAWPLGDPLISP